MARKIKMIGKNVLYTERRAVDMKDDDREVIMEGDNAQYQEFVEGTAAPQNFSAEEFKEAGRKLLMDSVEFVEPIVVNQEKMEAPSNLNIGNDAVMNPEESIIANIIRQMDQEGELKKKGDWGLLMIAMNQTDGMLKFATPRSFVDYLTDTLRLDGVPSESSVSKMVGKTRGMFPQWKFDDTNDTLESNRRINVGKRFISAVRKLK
jgi:hypothetical protein